MAYNTDALINDLKHRQQLREAFLEGLRVGLNHEGEVGDKEEFRHFVDSAWYEYIDDDRLTTTDDEVTLDL